MASLIGAIHQYQTEYTRMPVSKAALASATEASPDFTYGTTGLPPNPNYPTIGNTGNNGYQTNNAEVIDILRNIMNWSFGPDGSASADSAIGGKGGVNKDNVLSWE